MIQKTNIIPITIKRGPLEFTLQRGLSDEYLFLRKKEEIERLNSYIKRHGKNKVVEEIEKSVIESKSATDIVWFAKYINKADIESLQKALIETGDLRQITSFAAFVKGADIKELQDKVVELGTTDDILTFLAYVKNADVLSLQKIIIKTWNGDVQHFKKFDDFAHGKGDVKAFLDATLKTQDSLKIFNFLHEFGYAWNEEDVKKIEDAVIKVGSPIEIASLAKDLQGANIKKLKKAIIETKDITGICFFSKFVKNINIKEVKWIQQKAIESLDAEKIFKVANCIKDADIRALQNALLKSSPENIEDDCNKNAVFASIVFKFAQLKGAEVESLQDKIFETKDITYIKRFAEEIDGINLPKFIESIDRLTGEKHKVKPEHDLIFQ